ncbi:MAG: hypothetical protein WCT17_05810, partial [Bacilli bacterium]
YQAIIMISPELIQNSNYSIYLGGTITGSIENGYYEDAVLEGATLLKTITLSLIVNTYNITSSSPSRPPRP